MKDEIKALAKIGITAAVLIYAMDLGKAKMFKVVKDVNPKIAEEILQCMKDVDDCDMLPAYKKARVKFVLKLCKRISK